MRITTRWRWSEDGRSREPDLPDGAAFFVVSNDDDEVTAEVTGPAELVAAAERHAAGLGTHVPQTILVSRWWLALHEHSPALHSQIREAAVADPRFEAALVYAQRVDRQSTLLAELCGEFELGISLDHLFRRAVLIET